MSNKKVTKKIMARDANGNRYVLLEITTFIPFENSRTGGANAQDAGPSEFFTETGEPVNKLSDTQFRTVISKIELIADGEL
jgi:hypothetical protein